MFLYFLLFTLLTLETLQFSFFYHPTLRLEKKFRQNWLNNGHDVRCCTMEADFKPLKPPI